MCDIFIDFIISFPFRKPNITKDRSGPNMINFEKEIRDGAFDSEVSPMRVRKRILRIFKAFRFVSDGSWSTI